MASKLIQLYSDEAATQKAYPICHEKGVFDSEGNESITAIKTALGNKVDKETGKGLSSNDYTTEEKNKLGNIEAMANKTIVDDALSATSTNPVQNKVVNAAIVANQTNILSVEDMICDTEFSTSTAYSVGDYVTYNNSLYEFTSAHSAGAWDSADVTEVSVVGIIGNINAVLEGVL